MDRGMEKRLKLNTVSSLFHQITAVVCGFIVPRAILGAYGSDVNGLVNSVAQFLHIIAFLELGVGAVVQTALYKPLVEKDSTKVSKVIASAEKFFRTIAIILVAYTGILVAFYNRFNSNEFDWAYTALLILAMSISYFAQYYFGVVDRLLLTADQKGYIQYTAQAITLILNALSCVIMVNFGASIQLVKLISSLVFLIRPVLLRIYVNKNYTINRRIKYEGEPIDQKWNGIAQHVAFTVLDSTDIVVLTVLSTLTNVSIYSVYHLVVYGIKQMFMSLTNGIQPIMGEYWARKDYNRLNEFFSRIEWVIHTSVVFLFGCTGALIIPFVEVYTKGVDDANYVQPLFAILLVLAHGCHCLRMPYNMLIFASGHYKQTQNNYFTAAIINIIVSVITVKYWGLIGVAIGTLVSMAYQTLWMAWFNSKNMIKRPIHYFVKQIIIDSLSFAVLWIIPIPFKLSSLSYLSWGMLAIEYFVIYLVAVIVINLIFYRDHTLFFAKRILRRVSQ